MELVVMLVVMVIISDMLLLVLVRVFRMDRMVSVLIYMVVCVYMW